MTKVLDCNYHKLGLSYSDDWILYLLNTNIKYVISKMFINNTDMFLWKIGRKTLCICKSNDFYTNKVKYMDNRIVNKLMTSLNGCVLLYVLTIWLMKTWIPNYFKKFVLPNYRIIFFWHAAWIILVSIFFMLLFISRIV